MQRAADDRPHLNLLLVDSELEMVPREFWSHPAVVQNAKKRGKKTSQVLLDASFHHSVFRDPDEARRRGRPDIVHQFLMLGLDSVLNAEGRLHLYVHTRNDELLMVDPGTRLPKNINRYMGLFEELFYSRAVPSRDRALLWIEDRMDLGRCIDLIKKEGHNTGKGVLTMLLSPEGEQAQTVDLFSRLYRTEHLEKNILCLIGGFPHGDFRSDAASLSEMKVGLSKDLLKAWTVESEVLVGFRQGTLDI